MQLKATCKYDLIVVQTNLVKRGETVPPELSNLVAEEY